MNEVFKLFIGHIAVVFFDDILIYSLNERDHIEHLRRVFEILSGHKSMPR